MATEGNQLRVTFDGLKLGIFAGDLRFIAYKGTNLLRQEAVAYTQEPSVAYIYKAGLKGFPITPNTKLTGATPRSTRSTNTSAEHRIRSR